MKIAPYESAHLGEIVDLSLRAWAPVFDSLREAMLPAVYEAFYPDGWQASQKAAVEAVCTDDSMETLVALEDGRVAGFVALRVHPEDRMGEIYMIAVDPDFQRRGIGADLTHHSVERFEQAGMSIVMVETGGDPGHAPARLTYESAGFSLLPVARYFKAI